MKKYVNNFKKKIMVYFGSPDQLPLSAIFLSILWKFFYINNFLIKLICYFSKNKRRENLYECYLSSLQTQSTPILLYLTRKKLLKITAANTDAWVLGLFKFPSYEEGLKMFFFYLNLNSGRTAAGRSRDPKHTGTFRCE